MQSGQVSVSCFTIGRGAFDEVFVCVLSWPGWRRPHSLSLVRPVKYFNYATGESNLFILLCSLPPFSESFPPFFWIFCLFVFHITTKLGRCPSYLNEFHLVEWVSGSNWVRVKDRAVEQSSSRAVEQSRRKERKDAAWRGVACVSSCRHGEPTQDCLMPWLWCIKHATPVPSGGRGRSKRKTYNIIHKPTHLVAPDLLAQQRAGKDGQIKWAHNEERKEENTPSKAENQHVWQLLWWEMYRRRLDWRAGNAPKHTHIYTCLYVPRFRFISE